MVIWMALTMDYTAIIIATLFLLLGLVMLTQLMGRVGHMTEGAGLTMTKWLILTLLGLFAVWGLYNQIGQTSGLWEGVTLDKWIGGFIQTLYNGVARLIQWLLNLIRGGKALLPVLLL